MGSKIVYEGSYRTIVWVSEQSGSFRGEQYFNGLSKSDKAKLFAIFERVADHPQFRNQEKFRHEDDGIYCFKSFQQRMLCFLDGNLICITHGFRKKRDEMPRNEMVRAKRIRNEYRSRR